MKRYLKKDSISSSSNNMMSINKRRERLLRASMNSIDEFAEDDFEDR